MEYNRVELKELCSLSQGLQIPIAKRFREEGPNRYFYVTVQFLKDSGDKYFIENPPERVKCTSKDILVVRTGNTGQIITGVNGCFHNNFFKVEPNEKIYPKFLYYTLKSPELYTRMRNVASGTTILDLKHSAFLGLDVYLPDLNNQKKIAYILDIIDQKIKTCESINDNLETLAKNIFKYYFIDYEPFQQLSFTDTIIGKVPVDWNFTSISNVIEVKDGTHDSPSSIDEGFHLITSKHLNKYDVNKKDANKISLEDYTNINKRSLVETYDILISMIGTVGNICYIMYDDIDFAIKNVGLFKTSKTPFLREYLLLYLKTNMMTQYIDSHLAGSTQKYISLTELRNIPLVVPPEEVLNEFKNIVNPIFNSIRNNSNEINKLIKLRDTLLPKLMSGEIDVSQINCDLEI